jgi:hypothetical protein
VLRQDELSGFIHDTKGGKYSALLPLLGLDSLETAAENLRQLAKVVETQSRVKLTRSRLTEVNNRRELALPKHSDDDIRARIEALYAAYCGEPEPHRDPVSLCRDIEVAIENRIEQSTADQRRQAALLDVAASEAVTLGRRLRTKSVTPVEPLVERGVAVLQHAALFVGELAISGEVPCPACGRVIEARAFKAHVEAENRRLEEIITSFKARTEDLADLNVALRTLKALVAKPDLAGWWNDLTSGPLSADCEYLLSLDPAGLQDKLGLEDLAEVESKLQPILEAARLSSREAPRGAHQLSDDKSIVTLARSILTARPDDEACTRVEAFLDFLSVLEIGIRDEIRLRSQSVIDRISQSIQRMWTILHPGEAIEAVRLYVPDDVHKAIDLSLQFHGVEQDSPRLTLSEGYRNSLGLCIFLAMSQRDEDRDQPLFLDDVVVSMDRNHRGMVIELLQREFGNRQVVVMTHDREWYAELRHQLDGGTWAFGVLKPYDSPALGIRWSRSTTTFDDARAQLAERPDSAGNDARKIMDSELATIAERLQVRLPYLRGDKNDRRVAHDFLSQMIADGKRCFQRAVGPTLESATGELVLLNEVDRLLLSWGNRASHSHDLVRPEAVKLIAACEKALEAFKCSSCGKPVWFSDAVGPEWMQCGCGQLRWRYGKA